MSIVKIQGVNRLDNAINYITQDSKTDDTLIDTFDCSKEFLIEEFNDLYEEREINKEKETKNKAKMIIQSFDDRDNITPEKAHDIGIELADNYLKGNHKYIIATHTDTDNIHNHIIFNEVRNDNLLMFDTTRRNTIDNLRLENDKLSKKYKLHIPKEKSHEDKINYISQRELRAREKGNSFKEKLENTIDEAIENSSSYEDFIERMEQLDFKSKEGKYLSFLNKDKDYFMRTKTLGINYTKNSIKYRIENKDFKIYKFEHTLKTEKIDKSQEKFKNNYGLKKWATKKNIAHLQEISHLVFNEKLSLEEIENIRQSENEFTEEIENTISKKDSIIHDLEKRENAFQDYSESASFISEYKKSDNKEEFKRNHYKDFKKFDNAKKSMYLLKKKYSINNIDDLNKFKKQLKNERNTLFDQYTKAQKDRARERDKAREKDREKDKELKNKKRKHRGR